MTSCDNRLDLGYVLLPPTSSSNMGISIPTLKAPAVKFVNPNANITLAEASAKLATFLQKGKGRTCMVTGAGVSVDSGIRAYRGKEGSVLSLSSCKLCLGGEGRKGGKQG
jgi:hypothetical protein